jgi:hypothetical protein
MPSWLLAMCPCKGSDAFFQKLLATRLDLPFYVFSDGIVSRVGAWSVLWTLCCDHAGADLLVMGTGMSCVRAGAPLLLDVPGLYTMLVVICYSTGSPFKQM